ncbi:MAG: biotin--[acetyl-CoA-carboxylase] ligase, partial [Exiguobacterium sp.]|nr:biotin--[acetyl-CoA-carboxylase] ligase [Exiguobacterium sp.]
PEELRHKATSMKLETGATYRRSELLAHLLDHLEAEYDLFLAEGFAPVRDNWLQHAAFIDEPVTLTASAHLKRGIMRGISEEGALLLERDGVVEPIYSAEIAVWND